MKVIDMHCDTLYALEKARLNNESLHLLDNNLNIKRRLFIADICNLYAFKKR